MDDLYCDGCSVNAAELRFIKCKKRNLLLFEPIMGS